MPKPEVEKEEERHVSMRGRKIVVLGAKRYEQMVVTLHRDRQAVFADPGLSERGKAKVVTAIDSLLTILRPLMLKAVDSGTQTG
jgi:hypothetical protein